MRHLRMISLCVLAAFALGAVVASAAQASGPEWGRCVKLAKAKGKYDDTGCTKLHGKIKHPGKPTEEFVPQEKGEYEWLPGAEAKCYNVKHKAAKYEDPGCTKVQGKVKGKEKVFTPQNKGEYELTLGPKFTGKGGEGILNGEVFECQNAEEEIIGPTPKANCVHYYKLGVEISCLTEKASGEAAGTNEVKGIAVRFTGCTAFGGFVVVTSYVPSECSPECEPGEVETAKLKGHLGYIKNASQAEREKGIKPQIGVVLEPETPHGLFAKLNLAEAEIWVGAGNATEGAFYEELGPGDPTGGDAVISPITPVNTMSKTFEQHYENAAHGFGPGEFENDPTHFEGGPRQTLEDRQHGPEEEFTSDWGPASEVITNTNTVEGEAEIRG